MRYVLVALLLATPAVAKDFAVNDQDQQVIQQACEVASRSPSIDISMTAQFAQWCVQWRQRVQSANQPAANVGAGAGAAPAATPPK